MLPDFLYIAVFGGATLIFGWGGLALLFAWLPTRRWVTAEARVEALDVTPRAGKYVRMNPRVTARYSYTYGGVRYEGTRISVFEVRPRIFNGYDPTSLRLLDESTIVEETVTIKLDPRHPQRSILLDPPVRSYLLVDLVFTVCSGLLLASVIYFDPSHASVAVGWGLAWLLLLIALLFRDGVMVLAILNG